MKRLRVLLPVAVLLAAVLYFGYRYVWLEDDERILHGRVDRLVELASKDGGETAFVEASRARDIAEHFTEEFHLDLGRPFPSGRFTRDDLTAAVVHARRNASRLRLRVSDRRLELDGEGGRAVMELTGHGRMEGGRGEAGEARRFRIEWVRQEGEWGIDRVELLEVLQ